MRALDILARVDVVACEDTRLTGAFLKRQGIAAKLLPYHDHNAAQMRPKLLPILAEGGSIALVSDAGTPLVSDPGFRLVTEAIAAGYTVTAIPGASAVLTSLQLSGLPTDRFLFQGFLPARRAARRAALSEIASVPTTLVFFESPHRLAQSLADMAEVLGNRRAAICREMTKRFEDVRRGPLADLAAHYARAPAPKGEIAIVVGPPDESRAAAAIGEEEIEARLDRALSEHSLRDAVALVAAETGIARGKVYALALQRAKTEGGSRKRARERARRP